MRTEKDQGEQRRYKGENRKMKRKKRKRDRQREGKNHEDRETRGEDARSKLPPPGSAEHYWYCLDEGTYGALKPSDTSHFTPYFEKCPYRNVCIYVTYIHT